MLGLARPDATGPDGEPELTGDDLLRERVRRAKAGLPPPTTRQGVSGDERFKGMVAVR